MTWDDVGARDLLEVENIDLQVADSASVSTTEDGGTSFLAHMAYSSFGNLISVLDTDGNPVDIVEQTRYLWQSREFDAATGMGYHRRRWIDQLTGGWMSVDPSGFTAGDMNLYRPMGNGPTNATDPTGLFRSVVHKEITMDALKSSSVNSKYWDRLAEYVEQPDYRQTLVMPTWHAQDPGFVDRVHERMIAIKDTPDPSVYSRELQHSVTETAVDYVLKNTGYMLHALQDFYSHTNWIDGPDLIPLYEYYYIRRAAPINQILIQQTFIVSFLVYEDLGESALIAQSSAASRHSNTLNLANLEAGLTDISLSPHRLIYFDGGFEPSGIRKSSQHGRYAVDAAGLGRDSSQAHSVGLFETFERAKSLGVKQTTDVLRWVEQRIPACVRKELFSRSNEK